MIIQVPNIGELKVIADNSDGTPSFHILFNGNTIAHAEMDLTEEQVKVFVWDKDCFDEEGENMSDFHMFEYPANFGGEWNEYREG